jgi:hypothetical protein
LIAIEDLQVGDLVWTVDLETGIKLLAPITATFGPMVMYLPLLHVQSGIHSVTMTAMTLLWTQNREWLEAYRVNCSQVAFFDLNASVHFLNSTIESSQPRHVLHQIEIRDYHSYFVGSSGLLMHNPYEINRGGTMNELRDFRVAQGRMVDRHHIPAKSLVPALQVLPGRGAVYGSRLTRPRRTENGYYPGRYLTYAKGAAKTRNGAALCDISIDQRHHQLTSTYWSPSGGAVDDQYRAEQKSLLRDGNWEEAIKRDLLDLHRIVAAAGEDKDYYKRGMGQLLRCHLTNGNIDSQQYHRLMKVAGFRGY